MSTPISALIPTSAPNVVTDITRRSAGYHPSIWGDYFLSYASESLIIDDNMKLQAEQLKEKVKRKLISAVEQPLQQLNLIDAIQRLGVSYHFESEIDEALQQMHKMNLEKNDDSDLHFKSLYFRLLRQHGYDIPCDIFHKFKDDKGNFKEFLIKDVQGILSLYEATHLRLHGEDILDEALAFTTIHLESMLTNLSPPLTAQVSHALKQPLRKGLPRLEARRYFSIYEKDALHDKVLLKFAKLDFNILQKLHQKEVGDISRWWKDLDFSTKLSFARDRVVECCFWILGVYFEPQYSLARRMLTKVIAMTSVIDDIYDVYGTLEELEIFTDAIQRWDISCIDRLPEYMKLCYQALLDVYEEIEKLLANQGRLYGVYHAKEAMKTLVQAYYVEAKWFNKDYIPTMDEYMHVALVSSGYPMLATTSFLGMGDIVTKEAFEWVSNNPRIVRASTIISRLMDDIVSHKFEQKRGHVASGIECYMKQYCVSEQQVYEEFRKQIVNAWKDVNREFLRPTSVPMPLLTRVLNLARVMDVVYKDGDGYTHAGGVMKNFIASLLIDSVPI